MKRSPGDELSGVLTVLPTPFESDGAIDFGSLGRVIDLCVEGGASGVVAFGLASELYKLTDSERSRILEFVVDRADGRVSVIAGAEANSIEAAVMRVDETIALGADAIMALPPSFVKPDEGTAQEYFVELGRAARGSNVIIQDAPIWTQVPLSVELMVAIRDSAPNVQYVKVENPPNASKIADANRAQFKCIGGFGLLHFLDDFRAGLVAVMPGAGLVQHMVEMWGLAHSDPEGAWRKYSSLLPVMTFQMSSLDTFVACQKAILHARGVITSEYARRPGRALTDDQREWLWYLLRNIEREHDPRGSA